MLTIPTVNQTVGRLRPIRVGVLHTAQVPCRTGRAVGVMQYLAGPTVRASCHWAVDPDNTVAGVAEANTAWATPSANADGIQVEQCGYAEFGSGDLIPETNKAARQAYGAIWPGWDDPDVDRMLRTQTAPLVAEISLRHNLPLRVLSPADLADPTARGWTDHNRCSIAFGGDHWDCGHHYPLELVLELAADITGGAIPDTDNTQEADVVRIIRNKKDGSLYWWNGQTRAQVGVNAGDDWPALETRLKNLIALHPSAEVWPAGTVSPDAKPTLFLELEEWDITAIPVA